ncbi:hypothetical protein C4D60_Mb05t13350 [Musa balbisiana]|uniref:Uncharacterized protein n=1 Tax=Musa balbisiana TaxID=52838 RepID=A0A4S8JVU4_MUSBA|nr:hypothetical protein C4D60_Mb05t13350 [Musa balbisiana]
MALLLEALHSVVQALAHRLTLQAEVPEPLVREIVRHLPWIHLVGAPAAATIIMPRMHHIINMRASSLPSTLYEAMLRLLTKTQTKPSTGHTEVLQAKTRRCASATSRTSTYACTALVYRFTDPSRYLSMWTMLAFTCGCSSGPSTSTGFTTASSTPFSLATSHAACSATTFP